MTSEHLSVKTSGPVFDPNFSNVVKITIEQGIADITKEGERRLQSAAITRSGGFQKSLHGRLLDSKHGRLAPDATTTSGARGRSSAYYTNALLGFWLETGKRKGEQTRFRGYHLFRRVRAQVSYHSKKVLQEIALKITVKGGR